MGKFSGAGVRDSVGPGAGGRVWPAVGALVGDFIGNGVGAGVESAVGV